MRQDDITIEMYPIKQLSDVLLSFMNKVTVLKEVTDLQVSQTIISFSSPNIYFIQTYFIFSKCCFDIKPRTSAAEINSSHLKIINKARDLLIPARVSSMFDESSVLAELLAETHCGVARYPERLVSPPTSEESLLSIMIK